MLVLFVGASDLVLVATSDRGRAETEAAKDALAEAEKGLNDRKDKHRGCFVLVGPPVLLPLKVAIVLARCNVPAACLAVRAVKSAPEDTDDRAMEAAGEAPVCNGADAPWVEEEAAAGQQEVIECHDDHDRAGEVPGRCPVGA